MVPWLMNRQGIDIEEAARQMAQKQLRRLPVTGEDFRFERWQFEVVDMDGRKIDKLLATRIDAD